MQQREYVPFAVPTAERGLSAERVVALGIRSGIREALSIIDRDFESVVDVSHRLTYHNRIHTKGAIWRTGTILRAMQKADPAKVSDRDIALGEFAAAWHDVYQEWEKEDTLDKGGLSVSKRKRAFKDNETVSAAMALQYMEDFNGKNGNVFTEADKTKILEAIMLTIPNFDSKLETVTQPDFEKYKDNPIAQALALADLGGSGMEGLSTAVWTMDTLFLEENMDIAEYVSRFSGQEADGQRRFTRDFKREEQYETRAKKWFDEEVRFVSARKTQLENVEIPAMLTQFHRTIRDLFIFGQEISVGITDLVYGKDEFHGRRDMNFAELIALLTYSLENPPRYDFSQSDMLKDLTL